MKSYYSAAVLAAAVSLDAVAAEEKRYFKIEEQAVNSALLEFALQAEISILIPNDMLVERKSNYLEGNYEPEEALQRLLKGTRIAAEIEHGTNQVLVQITENEKANSIEGEKDMVGRNRNRRNALASALAAALTGSVMGVEGVQAQDAADEAQSRQPLEEISVTGSRIRRTGMSAPTPVTVMGRAELEALARGSLMDGLD